MSKPSIMRGNNGDIVEESTGYKILDLFNSLVRGLDEEKLKTMMDEIPDIADLFVLTFQTRDCRGGKGERDLFYIMFEHLFYKYPKIATKMIPLIFEFGYGGDFTALIERYDDPFNHQFDMCFSLVETFVDKLVDDYSAYIADKEKPVISLASKWAPREGGSFSKSRVAHFRNIVDGLFEKVKSKGFDLKGGPMKVYRQLVNTLNKHIDTTEVKMCSGNYADIDFKTVPSVALNKWGKAFLNEKLKVSPTNDELEKGNRYPDNPDRVKARQNLVSTIKTSNVKGDQVFSYDIVRKLCLSESVTEKELLEAQWNDIVKKLKLGVSRPVIPMADVSGSMRHGSSVIIPMNVSIALSILLSEVTHTSFKNRVLTFESESKWVDLSDCETLESKIKKIKSFNTNAASTNIASAFRLILDVAVKNGLKSEEIPDLCIFSDMQFDYVCEDRSVFESMKLEFEKVGLTMPRVIFWNLTGFSEGHPTSGGTSNTIILSGFSQSLLKYVMYGTEIDVSPYTMLREILDSERYSCIRSLVEESSDDCK